ncbi:MAG: type II toxin-antitoxin system HicB family antitoxin [bacterium]
MVKKFTAVIMKEAKWYVAHCLELGVVSQGESLEEAQANLREAVELYIESFGDEGVPGYSPGAYVYQLEAEVSG